MGFSPERMSQVPAAVCRGLRRVGTTSWTTRWEYVTVVSLAGVTELAVRTVPLTRLARLYGVAYGSTTAEEAVRPVEELPAWAVRRLRVAVRVMRRWPVQGECLRHSLVAGQRLRALGPQLKLGVTRDDTGVVAHAWLEIGGRSLDPTASRYEELPSPRS